MTTTGTTSARRPPSAAHLTDEQVAEFGAELDAIRDEVLASRGQADADYIHRVIRAQRMLELGGREVLLFSVLPPAWVAGTAMLSVAKILENMEIGHNVLHGQWDWMRDPDIHSTTWEWDSVTPAAAWKHTHNDVHHTWTNVVGKDRDVGYTILRLSRDQPWHPGTSATRSTTPCSRRSSSGGSRSTTSSSTRSGPGASPGRRCAATSGRSP
jgi:NADPH-dependent stearoyl-CoA 9-desaturase